MTNKVVELAEFMHNAVTVNPPPGNWDALKVSAAGGDWCAVGAAGNALMIAQNILEDPNYLSKLLDEIDRLNNPETPDEGEDT